jgi:hypothetical protein
MDGGVDERTDGCIIIIIIIIIIIFGKTVLLEP